MKPSIQNPAILGIAIAGLSGLLLAACERQAAEPPAPAPAARTLPGDVDAARIVGADAEPGQWLAHGRTYDEQRFSPLDAIDDGNVGRLGLDWYFDFPTRRGKEATPLMIDGVLYVSGSWSRVFALDAVTGELLWAYDPKVPGEKARALCCDVVNRGVAAWQGRIFVGTLDGRLVALDAADGRVIWEATTIPAGSSYSITGAPRVVKGKVIIGNGGGEFGNRGYVSAFDAETGAMAWRFFTVPGDPALGFENSAMEMAAATWTGEWWKLGGGGTVWDSLAYDPELDLLYVGVGNGSPWNRQIRSPGGGDNLFLSSIVALRPETGEYVWHYQETPGETWDFTATQHMILADMEINGQARKVIMQAPKNGFFYVLDRATGEFLSAEKYTKVTWASHVDAETGRPVEQEGIRFINDQLSVTYPGWAGGHNWQPMSYSPLTRLVYIPAQQTLAIYAHDPEFTYQPGFYNTGVDWARATLPDDPAERAAVVGEFQGFLLAWDPIGQREVWRVQQPGMWNGGVLSTAGNLVFQGNGEGDFAAYRADSGERLWSADAQTGIMAPPITYAVDGKQYVAVTAGWGGLGILLGDIAVKSPGIVNRSRLLVYSLDATARLPEPDPFDRGTPEPPPLTASAEEIQRGKDLYHTSCFACHGEAAVSASSQVSDLRYMSAPMHKQFVRVTLDGVLHERGMAGYREWVTEEEAEAIHAYLIRRAHDLLGEMAAERQ